MVSVHALRRLGLTSFETQLVFEALAEAESGVDVATETSLLHSLEQDTSSRLILSVAEISVLHLLSSNSKHFVSKAHYTQYRFKL